MKNKTILIHIKSKEALDDFIKLLQKEVSSEEINYSREIKAMINEFLDNDWTCYLGTIDNFDLHSGIYHDVYCINNEISYDMSLNDLNNKISVMIIRNIGPLEPNFEKIQNYLKYMIENFHGKMLNNPKAMLRGMSKYYLADLNPEEVKNLGVLTIPTKIYPTSISYDEVVKEYPEHREEFLIKPVSGELSNSLKCLNDVDEGFFRWKEDKVQGWIIQPIQKEIWNGEYQLVFLGGQVIYGQQKAYFHGDEKVPLQENRTLSKYHPSEQEIQAFHKLIKYFEGLYQISIDICRIDFMKTQADTPILLEFEMVNPGFFIVYMDENDEDVKNIVRSIRLYCEKSIGY